MSNVLNFKSVDKSFGGLKVIDDVSFNVEQGSRTALIGPNGAGKTTVFNLLSGIYEVDKGSIILDENDITTIPIRVYNCSRIITGTVLLLGIPNFVFNS